ncbi:MAG: hypothetical protein ACYCPK_08035, partial [Acidimicrobiales bacterium]
NVTLPGDDGQTATYGASFWGWSDGTAIYAAGASFEASAPTTLTAVWSFAPFEAGVPTFAVGSFAVSPAMRVRLAALAARVRREGDAGAVLRVVRVFAGVDPVREGGDARLERARALAVATLLRHLLGSSLGGARVVVTPRPARSGQRISTVDFAF